MKFIKRPISLPQDLARWAQSWVKRDARERAAQPNFSAFVARLIAEEKRRIEGNSKAA